MDELEKIRQEINSTDEALLAGLAKRRDLTSRVIQRKSEAGLPLRDPRREEEILARNIQRGRDLGLDAHFVTRIFHEIIDDSVRAQQLFLIQKSNRQDEGMKRIAFQGIHGAYSHLAAQKHFARSLGKTSFVGYPTFEEVIESVEKGTVDYAFLPIENTTAGSINEVFDLLAQTATLYIVGEEVFRVNHCLLATDDVPIENIRRVYSHPQALKQCMKFLATLPNCELEYYTDTAMSARKVKEDQDPTQAAIASEAAAEQYGLVILRRECADQRENYTRFLVIAREPIKVDPRIPSKTSIILAVPHEEGALLKALLAFHQHKINLTKLDGSRPRPGAPFQYLFNVDFEGNLGDENVQKALQDLRSATAFLKILGTYPAEDRGRTAPTIQAVVPPKRSGQESPAQGTPDQGTAAASAPGEGADEPGRPAGLRLAARTARPAGTVVTVRGLKIGGNDLVVIAGPGHVESREQISACARHVRECGGRALLGGPFRPVTAATPSSPWGQGSLDLLLEAGRLYDLPVVAEVTHAGDVESLARQVDLLQVSASNMPNTGLLTAVGKVNRPVIIERGASASLEELLAAAELVLGQGNQQVLLCERGVRTLESGGRGLLDLAAIPVLARWTHLPLLVNPCPVAGQADLVKPLALAAHAVKPHGLILELESGPGLRGSSQPHALSFEQLADLMRALYDRT